MATSWLPAAYDVLFLQKRIYPQNSRLKPLLPLRLATGEGFDL